MKKRFFAALATGLFLVGMGGVAQALTLSDVGQMDELVGYALYPNSSIGNENDLISSVLGSGYTITEDDIYNVVKSEWLAITDVTGGYAHTLIQDPGWFFIKIANINANGVNTGYSHFLYQNYSYSNYAAINLNFTYEGTSGTIDLGNISNIGKISHIGEVGGTPVPEPATMLLFGTGLAGLAAVARRRKN